MHTRDSFHSPIYPSSCVLQSLSIDGPPTSLPSRAKMHRVCVTAGPERGARLGPARFRRIEIDMIARDACQPEEQNLKKEKRNTACTMYSIKCLGESLTSKNQRGGKIKMYQMIFSFFLLLTYNFLS